VSEEALTPREVEIARLVASGRSYKSIGRVLGITERTVRNHVVNAAEKLGGNGPPKVRLIVFVVQLLHEDRIAS
jgi:DNA-binding CsgD family transcriptional regulator